MTYSMFFSVPIEAGSKQNILRLIFYVFLNNFCSMHDNILRKNDSNNIENDLKNRFIA